MTLRQKQSGFTLLEVLIAIVVLVLGVLAVLPLFAVATSSQKRGIDHTRASLLAQRIAAELHPNVTNPRNLKDQSCGSDYPEYRYDAEYAPVDSNDPFKSAYVLRVRIRWTETDLDKSETFETIVHRTVRR